MNELIQQLVASVGVNQQQAEGGVGLLLKLAQQKLAAGDFAAVAAAIPGADALLGRAPQTGGGLLGGLASALGGNQLGAVAELISGLGKLGINADTARRFAPVVIAYLERNGHDQALAVLRQLIP